MSGKLSNYGCSAISLLFTLVVPLGFGRKITQLEMIGHALSIARALRFVTKNRHKTSLHNVRTTAVSSLSLNLI